MNCRNSEKVIDIVLLRVLAFYLTTILKTGTSMLLLIRVKNTGRALNRNSVSVLGVKHCLQEKASVTPSYRQDMETVY